MSSLARFLKKALTAFMALSLAASFFPPVSLADAPTESLPPEPVPEDQHPLATATDEPYTVILRSMLNGKLSSDFDVYLTGNRALDTGNKTYEVESGTSVAVGINNLASHYRLVEIYYYPDSVTKTPLSRGDYFQLDPSQVTSHNLLITVEFTTVSNYHAVWVNPSANLKKLTVWSQGVSDPNVAKTGDTVTIFPNPYQGYQISAVTYSYDSHVEHLTPSATGTFSFTMPDADVTITVSTSSTSGAYSVNVLGTGDLYIVANQAKANAGDRVYLYVKTVEGYKLTRLYYCSEANARTVEYEFPIVDGKMTYDFTMPDHNVYVFRDYDLSDGYHHVTPRTNGIDVDKEKAKAGEAVTITVTVPAGEKLTDLLLSSTSSTTGRYYTFSLEEGRTTYSFTMPDHDVSVFHNTTPTELVGLCRVSTSAPNDANGTFWVEPEGLVAPGTTVTVHTTPHSGYCLSQIGLGNSSGPSVTAWRTIAGVNGQDSYSFTMPNHDVQVSADWAVAGDYHWVTRYWSGDGGELSGPRGTIAQAGETVEIVLDLKNSHSRLKSLWYSYTDSSGATVTQDISEQNGKYLFTMPNTDVDVRAEFELTLSPYSVSWRRSTGYTIFSKMSAYAGDEVGVNVRLDSNYELRSLYYVGESGVTVLNCSVSPGSMGYTSFIMPESNVLLFANVAKSWSGLSHIVTVSGGSASPALGKSGTIVQLQAGSAPLGKVFDRWEITGDYESISPEATDLTSESTYIVLKDDDVTAKALWKDSAPQPQPASQLALRVLVPETGQELANHFLSNQAVAEVKEWLHRHLHVAAQMQVLTLAGKSEPLDDASTLEDCGLKDGDTLEFSVCKSEHSVTYIVVNGTWADGKEHEIVETVSDGSLPAQVPTSMKPLAGYGNGAWDHDPLAAAITADSTFVYSFHATGGATQTKTVVWLDGDGEELDRKSYVEGEDEPVTHAVPGKASDADNHYVFSGWLLLEDLGDVKVYEPKFVAVERQSYVVVWLDGDGTELDRATYKDGEEKPTTSKVPTMAPEAGNTYVFESWDEGEMDGHVIVHRPTFSFAHEHVWGEWRVVREPTSAEEGEEERVCVYDSTHREVRALPAVPESPEEPGLKEGWNDPAGDGSSWCFVENGEKVKARWIFDAGWYYLDNSGDLVTGWLQDGFESGLGIWYYLSDGSAYGPKGRMATSWVFDSGWYYMNAEKYAKYQGMMVRNRMVDGWTVGLDGRWIA